MELLLRQPVAAPSGAKSPSPEPQAHGEGCAHCGLPTTNGAKFCCTGCKLVHTLLLRERLDRYYSLRGKVGQPVSALGSPSQRAWVEPLQERIASSAGLYRLDLDVQGLHCAACVWLIEQLFARSSGGAAVIVNPALGRVQLTVKPGYDLGSFVERVESFGYRLGPARKIEERTSSDLVVRMGISLAIAMNAMLYAIAIYAGLSEGPIFELFHGLSLALALISVAVGGPVFFRSAWQALKQRTLHLDVPIALGILLAFLSSTWSLYAGRHESTYFDTLSIFIALMLVGRYLQERIVEKNRRYLLADDGIDGLLTRRLDGESAALVPCSSLRQGDRLLIAPGDLVPVTATLEDTQGSFSLDWINGESEPLRFTKGSTVPAGAFLAEGRAVTVCADQDFGASPLVDLLKSPIARAGEGARAGAFWQRLSGVYVVLVLLAAAGGLGVGYLRTGSLLASIDVVTAVLIVTCPCALGIAAPLAYELAYAGLRRAGLFVRSPGFLDRARAVRRVVFDKTGTLTTGALRVVSPDLAQVVSGDDRAALYNLAARSAHPKSLAVRSKLDEVRGGFLDGLEVTEHPGEGLSLEHRGKAYRLGSSAWAGGAPASAADLCLSVDGRVICDIHTEEDLRPAAADDIERLRRDGYEIWIASGDSDERVRAVAGVTGVHPDHVVSEQSPADKAALLRRLDKGDTLMIGDGINDSLAVSAAHASGTPAIDRPFMAARSDFYFITPGLGTIHLALRTSRALHRVLRRNLTFAVTYNLGTVGLAYAGLMSPLLCAIVMPLSSLATISLTFTSLSDRSTLWRS